MAPTFVFLLLRPHTWQNLQRLQHQFSLDSSLGRSSGVRQKSWKGSQQIWQKIIYQMKHIRVKTKKKILHRPFNALRAEVPRVFLYWRKANRRAEEWWWLRRECWGHPLATRSGPHSPPGEMRGKYLKAMTHISFRWVLIKIQSTLNV